jgi:hypothetical protein
MPTHSMTPRHIYSHMLAAVVHAMGGDYVSELLYMSM